MTNPTAPGADEQRMQRILRERGVGPDAIPPPPTVPPKPTERPRDWLDDLYDSEPAPAPVKETVEPDAKPKPETVKPEAPAKPKKPQASKARQARLKKRKRPKRHDPNVPRTAWDTEVPNPRQSLLDAWAAVPYRLKWLGYHLAAAYLGWMVGLVGWATYVTTWIATTGPVGFQAFLWYAAAAATFLLHRRTRSWWRPVAFLAAVPASSTVVGVLLYGTPHP